MEDSQNQARMVQPARLRQYRESVCIDQGSPYSQPSVRYVPGKLLHS
jgi:hypothetical protein